ncbi:MAG: histidine kinase, partial [Spirulina sp. SIO3F2]|nr:histidine kinase [Spirulina sp. SIO3F2]
MSLTATAIVAIAKETLWPIAKPVFEEMIASELGQATTGGLEQLKGQVAERFEALSLRLTRSIEKYAQSYTNRHGILKVLGMREPVNLDDVYTNVRLLNEYSIRDFISTDALETAFRESSQRRLQGERCETRVGVEVASEQPFSMVLGQPGAGKSTFLRKLGLEALKGKTGDYQHQCIPVFLELKRFDSNEVSIQQRIVAEFET